MRHHGSNQVLQVEVQNNVKVLKVHSDKGGDYKGQSKYLVKEQMEIEYSVAYCPETNGIAE